MRLSGAGWCRSTVKPTSSIFYGTGAEVQWGWVRIKTRRGAALAAATHFPLRAAIQTIKDEPNDARACQLRPRNGALRTKRSQFA